MGAPEKSREELPTVEVKIVYKASGRVVNVTGPATGKLFDWVREIDAGEEVLVVMGPVENPPR